MYTKFNASATYSGEGHDNTKGIPGHGNKVSFDDGRQGHIILSNWQRSLVEYYTREYTVRDWFPNDMLSIHSDHIVSSEE